MIQDASVRLPAGILGVLAGTEVRALKENGDTLHVTDGHDEFDVKKSQVTNDLELAARIRKAADASASADDRARAQGEALYLKQQQEQIDFYKTHPLATPTPTLTPVHR